jgi:hypothetical protein
MTPPRTKYPVAPVSIRPGLSMVCVDGRIKMNNVPCGKLLTGKVDMRLKYGRPGKERFETNIKFDLEASFHPSGMASQIRTHPVE